MGKSLAARDWVVCLWPFAAGASSVMAASCGCQSSATGHMAAVSVSSFKVSGFQVAASLISCHVSLCCLLLASQSVSVTGGAAGHGGCLQYTRSILEARGFYEVWNGEVEVRKEKTWLVRKMSSMALILRLHEIIWMPKLASLRVRRPIRSERRQGGFDSVGVPKNRAGKLR